MGGAECEGSGQDAGKNNSGENGMRLEFFLALVVGLMLWAMLGLFVWQIR